MRDWHHQEVIFFFKFSFHEKNCSVFVKNKRMNDRLMIFKIFSVNGTPSIVQGNYLYYHYTHGNTNDSGWGCAYRSLQTLFSWYKYVLPHLFHRIIIYLYVVRKFQIHAENKATDLNFQFSILII